MTERIEASKIRHPIDDEHWRVVWWNESMRMMLPADHVLDRVNIYNNGTMQLTIKLKPEVISEIKPT